MLRPATPLTILLFAAFVLLLISTISAPIVKAIPLAQHEGVNMGVFGYCKGDQCSKFAVGYDPTSALGSDSFEKDFNLPVATRRTISAILIIHPIACFFTLIMLILAGVSHLHKPSHSPRYLLGVFILSILTLVLALLSFLIDVLLFVPHMAWGSYIVLAATVLIAASGVVSCAMRRTLVSRKARKRRIAENAEMNGENYYNRQAEVAPVVAPLAPTFDGGQPGNDKLPAFATFETSKENHVPISPAEEDRIPLTMRTRSPSEKSPEAGMASLVGQAGPVDRYHNGSQPGSVAGSGTGSQRGYGEPRRDQYGNVIPPPQGQGYGAARGDPRNQFGGNGPQEGYRGRGGPGGFRGRGGAPGYGRGGYGGPGGPAPYAQNERGITPVGAIGAVGGGMIAGGMGGRGGRGPPPGYNNQGYGRGGRNDGYSGRAQSPGNYGPGGYDQSQAGPYDGPVRSGSVPPHQTHDAYGVAYGGRPESLARAESPPPLNERVGLAVGQAIEMDAHTGGRSPRDAPQGFGGQYGNVRDSDTDVQGMVTMQQQRLRPGPTSTVVSDGSKYSQDVDGYGAAQAYSRVASPLTQNQNLPQELDPSPIGSALGGPAPAPHRRQPSGDNYYEDVDPRFVQPGSEPTPAELSTSPLPVPVALVPGYGRGGGGGGGSGINALGEQGQGQGNQRMRERGGMGMDGSTSYEDLRAGSGARSPSESERSNFTSVSQRGINPRWPGNAPQPQMPPLNQGAMRGYAGGYAGGKRAPAVQRNEVLLEGNPDFQLPGVGGRNRRPVGGGGAGGMGQQGRFSPSMGGQGLTGRSPYDQPGGAM